MKGNKGITLIALVVTIIVLLILAGVAIAMLTGDNSILKRAQSTQAYSAIGAAKDEVNLAYNAAFAEYMKEKYETTNTTAVASDRFKTLLTEKINKAKDLMDARESSAGKITITQADTNIKIEYLDKQSNKKYSTTAPLNTGVDTESLGSWSAVDEPDGV